ncbi:hypothetical protein LO763_21835 [Glycomyces sp. A-F 0318]|uniref:hypothetical protein n=1 Tax=Glycomyces amatae TaxID=2881355 RepID=UPI001E55FA1B|nr:hypothetical protein [Glycomyces amatae]MCD0446257.1 hypothetical protein [Glycomyces amatae]
MRRVVVVGSAGAGKTHVARAVSARHGLPLVHLDAIYYDANWNPTPPAAFAAAQERQCAAEAWVIDGNHVSILSIRLARADAVVVVDVPTVAALWGAVSRPVRHGPGQHEAGVYNRLNWGGAAVRGDVPEAHASPGARRHRRRRQTGNPHRDAAQSAGRAPMAGDAGSGPLARL